jgi:uncharacterized membrane-anchored protein YitT (DUF2179 family)
MKIKISIEQPFTFGKYLIGVVFFNLLLFAVSYYKLDEIFLRIAVYAMLVYSFFGFILWVYQTIKYSGKKYKLNKDIL